MKHIFWTADERSNRRKILTVSTQLTVSSCEKKAWKKIQAWMGFDPMTSAMPFCDAFLSFCSSKYMFDSYIHIHLFILHGYITNSQYDQLPVSLIAQLLEHYTGIAGVMDLNPIQAWIFFRLSFHNIFLYLELRMKDQNRRKILAVSMQLKQLWKESLKKIQAWTEFKPMTSVMPVQCSTN